MIGMSTQTGQFIDDLDHLRQSIVDILMTPIGSRIMRREYGSDLFNLIDAPMNRDTIIDIYAATAIALARWEPRIKVSDVRITNATIGQIELSITGKYLVNGKEVKLDGLFIQSRYTKASS